MIFIKKDSQFKDEFEVLDEDNNPVTGLVDANFTHNLYNPSKNEVSNISGGVPVTIEEIGNGLYRVNFTPDALGNWVLVVYHSTHFPWGKGDNYICITNICDDLLPYIKRILGLSQENMRVINPVYQLNNDTNEKELVSGKIRIYDSASDCNSNVNHIAEYNVTATYDSEDNMSGYKVVKA